MSNEIIQKPVVGNVLTKINDVFMPQVQAQLEGHGLVMTDYQKQCVLSSIQAINTVLVNNGKTIHNVDQANMTETLMTIAALQVNASAVPREVYFKIRNVKRKDANNRDNWIQQIESGIEGDGNDAILSKFGRNVKKVHRFWEVREGDHFVYPGYKGLEMSPPEWGPTGEGKVVRVVYPIEMEDGRIEYHIAERADVVRNLQAHINQNLMNETFGIAESKFKATEKQKKEIDAKKKEITSRIKEKSLDELLADETVEQYISPAWKSPQSSESMLVRKMRNNIVKKIPKNFENAYVAMTYQEKTDDILASVRKDVTENTASEPFDFDNTSAPSQVIEAEETSEPQKIAEEALSASEDEEIVSNEQVIEPDSKDEGYEPVQAELFEEQTITPKKIRGF